MTYAHQLDGQNMTLTIQGDLIGETKGIELVEIINNVLNAGVRYALVDIADVRYINSSGIGVLITILTKFRNKGGEMYLIQPSEHVKKLLIITKLQAIFNIVNSKAEALGQIS
ncbi:MAG: STAS domain-containing protein [Cyclobacteriaceae bacterium]